MGEPRKSSCLRSPHGTAKHFHPLPQVKRREPSVTSEAGEGGRCGRSRVCPSGRGEAPESAAPGVIRRNRRRRRFHCSLQREERGDGTEGSVVYGVLGGVPPPARGPSPCWVWASMSAKGGTSRILGACTKSMRRYGAGAYPPGASPGDRWPQGLSPSSMPLPDDPDLTNHQARPATQGDG